MKNENLKISRDWNREGALIMHNDTTVKTYEELTEKKRLYSDPCIFYAFDQSAYDRGVEIAKKYMREGEKILRGSFGMFATQSAYDKMLQFFDEVDNEISQKCDPQEVYCFEYNNHECMINYEGDFEAFKIVRRIFGDKVAKTIKRWDAVDRPE